MPETMPDPRHTARAIVIHDNQLLLMERWRAQHHYFSIPGGGIDPGEAPEQTVVREIAEEMECAIVVKRPLYVMELDGNTHTIYLCEYISGNPHLSPSAPEAQRHDANNRFEPRWLPIGELATAPFLIWQPIQKQLLHDLDTGFADDVIKIVADQTA